MERLRGSGDGGLLLSEVPQGGPHAEGVLRAAHEARLAPSRLALLLARPLEVLPSVTPAAPDAPLVVVCGVDHANLAEEQEVFATAGVRFQASKRSTIHLVRNEVLWRYNNEFARARSRTKGTLP